MAAPDPVDARLLTIVAETGRVAVHVIAMRLNMDVRDVAARLAALSTSGLPLIVSAEGDPQGIRNAIAAAGAWQQHPQQHQSPHGSGPFAGSYSVYGPPHSGPYSAQSGPLPAANTSGPSGPQPVPAGYGAARIPPQQAAPTRVGTIGSRFDANGPNGERITLQLIEVVDPADFLYSAAGHHLEPGKRSVVVHLELTNRGSAPLPMVADQHLVLVTTDGSTIPKSQDTLSSRPPHQPGVAPGDTVGGHTVYVFPEDTDIVAVRWTPGPGAEDFAFTWETNA
jgi:hypothetical protein